MEMSGGERSSNFRGDLALGRRARTCSRWFGRRCLILSMRERGQWRGRSCPSSCSNFHGQVASMHGARFSCAGNLVCYSQSKYFKDSRSVESLQVAFDDDSRSSLSPTSTPCISVYTVLITSTQLLASPGLSDKDIRSPSDRPRSGLETLIAETTESSRASTYFCRHRRPHISSPPEHATP